MAAGHESLVLLERAGPCPLWHGCERIAEQLRVHMEVRTCSAAQSGLVRIEIEVDDVVAPVHWLSHQHLTPQLYFSDRSGEICLAGVGEANRFTEPAVGATPMARFDRRKALSAVLVVPRAHYYGATRPDAQQGAAGSPEWEAFGCATWVLPLLELQTCNGVCLLACHLYWEAPSCAARAGVYSVAQAASTALDVLGRVSRAVEPVPRHVWQVPHVLSRAEAVRGATPQTDALTQRVQLQLSHPMAPIHVVEWLVGVEHPPATDETNPPLEHGMLFLQLSHDAALLLLAPLKERLREQFDSVATAEEGAHAQAERADQMRVEMRSAAAATPAAIGGISEGIDTGMHVGLFGRLLADCGEYRRPASTTLFHRAQALVFSSLTIQAKHPDAAGSESREACLSSLIAVQSRTGCGQHREPFAPHNAENLNILSTTLLLEELRRCGLCHVVLCPGSRSAPLAIALSRSGVRHTIALDERGAGFTALGLARVTGRAAAVVVSSGTAVANLHPAVIEAAQDNVPLLLLTADRPPELRDTKANQTIDQVSLFSGGALRWFKDVPCPEPGAALEPLLADASYAMARAHGCSSCTAGPVQLNLMFREPLSPKAVPWPKEPLLTVRVAAWIGSSRPFTVYSRPLGVPMPGADGMVAPIVSLLAEARRGVILAGCLRTEAERLAVAALGSRLGWPVLPDVCSGLRGPHRSTAFAPVVPLVDLLLAARPLCGPLAPDVCLQVGGRIVGRRLQGLAASARSHIVIEPHGERCDPLHSVTHRVQGPAAPLMCSLHTQLGNRRLAPSPLLELCAASRALEAALAREFAADDVLSEIWVCRHVSEVLTAPGDGAPPLLFSSNSGPIRHLDTYCALVPPVLCNRGASGIDGIMHTALGVAVAHAPARCTLVIGDLAALHDLSGLALLSQQAVPLTVVILNNAGGGIFRSLPIALFPDIFSPYFDTPHPHRFGLVCQGFGLDYTQASTRDAFAAAYKNAQARSCPTIIEVITGADEHAPLAARMTAAAREVAGTLVL